MTEVAEEKAIEKGKQMEAAISSSPIDVTTDGNNYSPYPPPIAKYDEVIADRELFIRSLEKLHATLGTKFMVPTIGGKELDLHRLFVEVTSRGGIEKVIRERRWKEITAVFSFPSTATNASFVLRKYYMSLMHHYEKIYFFGAKGWNPTPPAEKPSEQGPTPESGGPFQKRKRSVGDHLSLGSAQMPANYPVVGVIDGKFEHGYLVTVMVGAEKLKGVLYHTAGYAPGTVPLSLPAGNSTTLAGGGRRRRRRKKLSTLDPTHPKPNRSGYNFFFAEQHARLKPLHPGKDREISKIIGDLWSKLSDSEKSVYQERGVQDKERYKSEMVVYRERQKTGGQVVICNAVPIRQQLTELPANGLPANGPPEKMMEAAGAPAISLENGGGSSTGTEAERKLGSDSTETETSTEADGGVESANRESLTDSDGFELRRRDNAEEVSGPDGGGGVGGGGIAGEV
ncbi:high mobility group B protein 9-like [Wolffia australiana]